MSDPLLQTDRMTIKTTLRFLARKLPRRMPGSARRQTPPPPPEQLPLNLDQLTASGLPLREAIPVRSAEFWLQLGEREQALKELQTLPEPARRHAWPRRVHLQATHVSHP